MLKIANLTYLICEKAFIEYFSKLLKKLKTDDVKNVINKILIS